MQRQPEPDECLRLVFELSSSAWLLRHHELVLEAARQLRARLHNHVVDVDWRLVECGAAIHDVGKALHPEEMRGPGHQHEVAGQQLLIAHGFPLSIATMCTAHAEWTAPERQLEELLVALADKVWKGVRLAELEESVARAISARSGVEYWSAWQIVDGACEEVAAAAESRLTRSRVHR